MSLLALQRGDISATQHIIVFAGGRPFSLPVYNGNGDLLTIGDLEMQIDRIQDHAAYLKSLKPLSDAGEFVGALTSMNRDEWANARQELIACKAVNRHSLEAIQSSLFVVCLDDTTPRTPSELAKECAMGSCGNRWYDKSFQYIVFRNGMVRHAILFDSKNHTKVFADDMAGRVEHGARQR